MAEPLTIPLVGPPRTSCAWPTVPPCPRPTRVYVTVPPGGDGCVGVCRQHERRWERQYAPEIAAHHRGGR